MSTDKNFWIFSFDRYWTSAVPSAITIATRGHFHDEKFPDLPTGRGKKGKNNCRIEACSLAGQPLVRFCSVFLGQPLLRKCSQSREHDSIFYANRIILEGDAV